MSHPTHKVRSILASAIGTLLAVFAPQAEASPALTYNIKNLGPSSGSSTNYGWTPNYASDSGGGLVIAADGSAYRFNPSSYSQVSTAGLPLVLPTVYGQMDYSDPNNSYNVITSAYRSSSGLTVYIETTGISGHDSAMTNLTAMPGDGQGEGPTSVASVPGSVFESAGPSIYLSLAGMNNLSQVLFLGPNSSDAYGISQSISTYLYDSASGSTVDLSALAESTAPSHSILPIAIDDQGRILLQAEGVISGSGDLLLYSPTNLADGPVSVPEPSLIAFRVRRGRSRAAKGSTDCEPLTAKRPGLAKT